MSSLNTWLMKDAHKQKAMNDSMKNGIGALASFKKFDFEGEMLSAFSYNFLCKKIQHNCAYDLRS